MLSFPTNDKVIDIVVNALGLNFELETSGFTQPLSVHLVDAAQLLDISQGEPYL